MRIEFETVIGSKTITMGIHHKEGSGFFTTGPIRVENARKLAVALKKIMDKSVEECDNTFNVIVEV